MPHKKTKPIDKAKAHVLLTGVTNYTLRMTQMIKIQTKENTLTDNSQPSTATGTYVPQDLNRDINVQLPQSVPKALTIQKVKGKGK